MNRPDNDRVTPCACRFRHGVWHRCPTHAAIAERRHTPELDEGDLFLDAAHDIWRVNHLGSLDVVGETADSTYLKWPFAEAVAMHGPLWRLRVSEQYGEHK